MGALSRLDAVNRILRGSSENPVAELSPTTTNETYMAEQLLDNTNIRNQMTGFNCNTVVVELEPDGVTDQIELPNEVLTVMAWFMPEGGKNSLGTNVVQRGTTPVLLFDVENDTDEWDESVVVKYSVLLDFDDLPTAIQFMIADEAAMLYQSYTQGDSTMTALLTQIALQSRALGRAADIRSSPHNAFENGRDPGPRMLNWIPRSWR